MVHQKMTVGAHLVRDPHVHHHLVDGGCAGGHSSGALGEFRDPGREALQALHIVNSTGALRRGAPAVYGAKASYDLKFFCVNATEKCIVPVQAKVTDPEAKYGEF